MKTSSGRARTSNPRSQRGWLRNPFPSSRRLLHRMVANAMRMFAQTTPRKALFETLEPRLLLSGNPLTQVTDAQLTQEAARSPQAWCSTRRTNRSSPWPSMRMPARWRILVAATASNATLSGPTAAELDALFSEAAARMSYVGDARIEVVDLHGPYLARAAGDLIRVDLDATGYGWFVDPTPPTTRSSHSTRRAANGSRAPKARRRARSTCLPRSCTRSGISRAAHAGSDAPAHDVMQAYLGPGCDGSTWASSHSIPLPGRGTGSTVSCARRGRRIRLTITPTVTWITNGSWETAANWSTGLVPGPTTTS